MDSPMSEEHKKLLQVKRQQLNEGINSESLVLELYSNSVITTTLKQEIQSKPTAIRQCDALLDVIQGLPEWIYYKLLDALHSTGQYHVIDLLSQNYTLSLNKGSLISSSYLLANELDLTELPDWLQSEEVLTILDIQNIQAGATSFKQNTLLLELLQMKSDAQIQTFIQGLIECNQFHLAQIIDPSVVQRTNQEPLTTGMEEQIKVSVSSHESKEKPAGSLDILREEIAELYLSKYKKIILWGTNEDQIDSEVDFEAIYTDMTWVRTDRAAAVLEKEDLEHYTDMLKNISKTKILIWGEAGVGKTTFCSKLCQDWAFTVTERENKETEKLTEEQRHLLSNIGLLLYIVFRDTNEEQSLVDVVKQQIIKAISKCSFDIENVELNSDILLVCDGLDEVSYEQSELLEIISGRMYPNLRCIVTCRPHVLLGKSLGVDIELRLKGFTLKQAKHFVEVYFKSKYDRLEEKALELSRKVWKMIEKSVDLLEMATNPSMLQLLCFLYFKTGKMISDRASVFKQYTHYLLKQYHSKHNKSKQVKGLEDIYKDTLMKAGMLALQGLKQSHLQLVFEKERVLKFAGNELFDFGFLSVIPGYDPTCNKVQFIHKSLQEYLAAFAVVNSSGDTGMKYLMEFCATSNGFMGSHIILSFITAMSKKMGKVIQNKIKDMLDAWDSEDDITPRDRVSFLLTMVKGDKSLTFPLPKEIDIDAREHEIAMGWFGRVLHYFGRQSHLERFFSFESSGVIKLSICLGQKYRLDLLKGLKNSNLMELFIMFGKSIIDEDLKHVIDLIDRNKKLTFMSLTVGHSQDINDLFYGLNQQNSKYLKVIKVKGLKCHYKMAEAVKTLPRHLELDLSDNNVTDKAACISLINKAGDLQSLKMANCDIKIDEQIGEAVSRLPDNTQLDLSGNRMLKMKPQLLSRVLNYMPQQKQMDIDQWGINIDVDIVKAISNMSSLTYLNFGHYYLGNCNRLTAEAARQLAHTVKSLPQLQTLYLYRCDISNDDCVSLISSLSRHCSLIEKIGLGSNHLSSLDWIIHIKEMTNLRGLLLYGNPCMKQGEKIKIQLKKTNPDLKI